jgi:hypothetical protein
MGHLADHELRKLVTAGQMRRALAEEQSDWGPLTKTHPLVVPGHEQDKAKWDRSVLLVPLPLRLPGRPRNEAEKLLQPLSQLCAQHRSEMEPGWWHYEWFYLELLDQDEEVQPLCWISSELLDRSAPEVALGFGTNADSFGPRAELRLLSVMDAVAERDLRRRGAGRAGEAGDRRSGRHH